MKCAPRPWLLPSSFCASQLLFLSSPIMSSRQWARRGPGSKSARTLRLRSWPPMRVGLRRWPIRPCAASTQPSDRKCSGTGKRCGPLWRGCRPMSMSTSSMPRPTQSFRPFLAPSPSTWPTGTTSLPCARAPHSTRRTCWSAG